MIANYTTTSILFIDFFYLNCSQLHTSNKVWSVRKNTAIVQ